jgi:hypothetical protein
MKFKKEHYDSLKESIVKYLENNKITIADFKKERRGLTDTRINWDLFWLCAWHAIYKDHYNDGDYMDSHIQTALTRIVKELEAM